MSEALIGMNSAEQSEQRNLLAFRLDQQMYALPVEPIVQIIPMVTITPLPQVSDTVEGVINVRGGVVPVVNMRRHLKLPYVAPKLHTPILLTHMGEWTVGLIVDEVVDVYSLSPSQIVPPMNVLPERLGEASILQGLAHISGTMGLLLDPEHLFLPHQMEALAQAASLLPELIDAEGGEEQQTSEEAPTSEPDSEDSA
jgi:purine-binding chemotaxis protein CheW